MLINVSKCLKFVMSLVAPFYLQCCYRKITQMEITRTDQLCLTSLYEERKNKNADVLVGYKNHTGDCSKQRKNIKYNNCRLRPTHNRHINKQTF